MNSNKQRLRAGLRPVRGGWVGMDIHVIALDETEYWTLDDDFTQEEIARIGGIFTVYAYDRNSVTHLCEVTPSYTLWPLYMTNTWADGWKDLYDTNPDFVERVDELLVENEDHCVTYRHTWELDAFVANLPADKQWQHAVIGDPGRSLYWGDWFNPMKRSLNAKDRLLTTEEYVMEEVCQELRENCPI